MESTKIKSRATTPIAIAIALAALAALGWTSAGRADFQVTITEDPGSNPFATNGSTVTLIIGSPPPGSVFSTNANGMSWTYNGMIGGGVNPDFSVSITVDSNSNNLSAGSASLGISSTITRETATVNGVGASHNLVIVASDNNYTAQTGPFYTLNSSSTAEFTNTDSGDSQVFTGYGVPGPTPALFAHPSSSMADTGTLSDTLGTGPSGGGSPPNSYNSPTVTAMFHSTPPPFGMTDLVSVLLAPSDLASGNQRSVQVTDSSIVTGAAVPEPASWALMGLGGLGLAALHRRRCRRAA